MTHGFRVIRAVSKYINSRREDSAQGWDNDNILSDEAFQWMAQNPDFYSSDMEEQPTMERHCQH